MEVQVGILGNRCRSASICIHGWALLQYTSIVGLNTVGSSSVPANTIVRPGKMSNIDQIDFNLRKLVNGFAMNTGDGK